MDIKLIIVLVLVISILAGVGYFLVKLNILKRKKRIKLNENTVIIYNDDLNKPPL